MNVFRAASKKIYMMFKDKNINQIVFKIFLLHFISFQLERKCVVRIVCLMRRNAADQHYYPLHETS